MAEYYKRLIFGEGDSAQEFKLAVNLSGEGAPDEAVAADVGMLYIDSSSKNGDLYKCIAVTATERGTAYTWKKLVDNSIYVLKEGETIEDAPDDAIIVIDPYDDAVEEDNSVKYVAQELTDAQKAQARENIGAQVTSVNGKTGAVTVKETDPDTVPNKASVDGSTLKMQRETAGGVTDLFEVDLPSGSGGGSSEDSDWELLSTVTLEEAAQRIDVVLDNPIEHIVAKLYSPQTEGAENAYTNTYINGKNLIYYFNASIPNANSSRQYAFELEHLRNGIWLHNIYICGTNLGANQMGVYNIGLDAGPIIGAISQDTSIQQIERVAIASSSQDAAKLFPVGTIFRVWGKK